MLLTSLCLHDGVGDGLKALGGPEVTQLYVALVVT